MVVTPDSIRLIGEADFLRVTQVARSTWKNWSAKGLVLDSGTGLFDEVQVVETAVVSRLVGALDLRTTISCWSTNRHAVLHECMALSLEETDALDAIVDLHTLDVLLARSPRELESAVREITRGTTGCLVVPVGEVSRLARRAFWSRAQDPKRLRSDKRRRSIDLGKSHRDQVE